MLMRIRPVAEPPALLSVSEKLISIVSNQGPGARDQDPLPEPQISERRTHSFK